MAHCKTTKGDLRLPQPDGRLVLSPPGMWLSVPGLPALSPPPLCSWPPPCWLSLLFQPLSRSGPGRHCSGFSLLFYMRYPVSELSIPLIPQRPPNVPSPEVPSPSLPNAENDNCRLPVTQTKLQRHPWLPSLSQTPHLTSANPVPYLPICPESGHFSPPPPRATVLQDCCDCLLVSFRCPKPCKGPLAQSRPVFPESLGLPPLASPSYSSLQTHHLLDAPKASQAFSCPRAFAPDVQLNTWCKHMA